MSTILTGAVDAIRSSPLLIGLFVIAGLLRVILPSLGNLVVRFLILSIGVVIAYQAIGGQIRADSHFLVRLLIAWITALLTYVVMMAAGVSLFLPGALGSLLFIALMLLGLYVYIRLFLAVPAVMIDGYGLDEALAISWRLMRGSMLSTAIAVGLVIVGVIVVIVPLFAASRSLIIASIASALFGDTVIVSMQAFLYSKLAELSEQNTLTDTGTSA